MGGHPTKTANQCALLHGIIKTQTISGKEFIKRYLRHVLPPGLRSIRYYGFLHPTAKKALKQIAFHNGGELKSATSPEDKPNPQLEALLELAKQLPNCPTCEQPMILQGSYRPFLKNVARGPPSQLGSSAITK